MAGNIRFCGTDGICGGRSAAVKIVGFFDFDASRSALAAERNNAIFRWHLLYRFNGIVHEVAEDGIGLYRGEEGEQGAVHHGGKLDAMLAANQIFLGKHHVQHVISCFHPGIIHGNGALQLGKLLLVQLSFDASKDVLEVVTFHADGIHARLYGFILRLILLPQLLENIHLTIFFALREDAGAKHKNDGAEGDDKGFDGDTQ